MIDLSIIIVSFNTGKLLEKCLESVISDLRLVVREKGKNKDTFSTPNHQLPVTEIIVVDNGSTDGSLDMLRQFKVQSSKFKVHLIVNQVNVGFAKAVNQGLRQAQGETLLLLNSDTQVRAGALVKLLEFEKKVGPAIVGLKMLNPDGTVQGSVFNLPTIKRAIEEFWLERKGSYSKFAPAGDKPVSVEAVSGGAMAISREVIGKIGFFDERYFMYFEDLDYCRKAAGEGIKVWYLPEAVIIHEHGASGRDLADKENQWKRLIPSSKIYHGSLGHWLITQIIRIGNGGQRLRK